MYPFTPGMPVERVIRLAADAAAQLELHDDIESLAAGIVPSAPPTELVVQFKLRRVLLLQSANARRPQVTVARVSSITPARRARAGWYERLVQRRHPAHYLIGDQRRHGTAGMEAFVDLLSVAPIRTEMILRRTGYLTTAEMRDISDRLVKTLELDISHLVDGEEKR
jgi:hypothetical protein